MNTGKIKFFHQQKRYGIITPEGVQPGDQQREVWFHETVWPGGVGEPIAGQDVEYSLLPGWYKPRALTIKLLSARGYVPITEGRKRGGYGD